MLNIRKIPMGKIRPAAYNPRKNLRPGDPEYEKLVKSIDEFDCALKACWPDHISNEDFISIWDKTPPLKK